MPTALRTSSRGEAPANSTANTAGQRRYGIDIQNIGAEIKLLAERWAGELLSAMPKNSGQLFRGDMMVPWDDTFTYTAGPQQTVDVTLAACLSALENRSYAHCTLLILKRL